MESAPVAIFGATGFIGRHLAARLASEGIRVTGVSRSPDSRVDGVGRWQTFGSLDLSGHRAVVNLSGHRVDCRWTEKNRRAIEDSRTGLTRRLVEHLRGLDPAVRPQVLVNGSGIGVYGDGGDTFLDETSPQGADYLARVCVDWEAAARGAETLGVRVVLLRTGVVLGAGGAAFDKLRTIFRLGLGGKLGSGRQWMPWIHLHDEVEAILHALRSPVLSGPLNLVAPHPERNAEFTRKFAAALHRPAFLPVPGFALKLALGEFAEAMLGGQRAVPAGLDHSGFRFRFPTLEEALVDLLGER
ncbi:TIGR01777 family oxidoreductase [Luteolibacter ambystomatis]|uniref:TIGR01777 family oxidoreductase n=1 Tax=Luteolibacter ambystomatis TaxID=2824561 RepID=A0A975G877_9BACT|nr:TIGR01777 family oxidoreductase [Luteolibacter ambystomatis]QUE50763.1 TIGR01777 family oxidoreductase [Luteolibacter ambystomatis]